MHDKNEGAGSHGAMKSKRINVWTSSLKIGGKGEKIVRSHLEDFIVKVKLKSMDYKLYPEIQLQGIDQIAILEKASFEVKTRLSFALQYEDILLEVKTGDKRGWFLTSKADYIAYVFLNKQKSDLVKGYLIAIQNTSLRKFVEQNLVKYPHIKADSEDEGQYWVTESIAIPISDFPQGTLLEFVTPKGKAWGANTKLL